MTRRTVLAGMILAVVLLCASTSSVCAQGAGGPSISPYLNLARGGNTAINYFGIVRPQFEFRAFEAQQQGAMQQLGRQVQGVTGGRTPGGTTAPGGYFMNYSHYYPSQSGAPRTRR